MKTKKQSNPWAALDAMMKSDPEPTGPEWFTVQQYTERYGGSVQHNTSKLNRDTRLKRWKGTSGHNRRITVKYSGK